MRSAPNGGHTAAPLLAPPAACCNARHTLSLSIVVSSSPLPSPRITPQPGVPEGTPVVPPLALPSRPRRNRRSETFRSATRETWLSPSHFILPLFVHEEGSANQPIASMPGVFRLAYGKNVVDFVAEARSLGVNQVVIFPKVS